MLLQKLKDAQVRPADLAKALAVSRPLASMMLSGKRGIPTWHLDAVADLLNISIKFVSREDHSPGNKFEPLTSPVPDVDPQLPLSGAHVLSTGDPDAAPTYRLSDADLDALADRLSDDDRARAIVDHAHTIIRLAERFGRSARGHADPRRRAPDDRPNNAPLRHGRTGTHGRRRKGGRS